MHEQQDGRTRPAGPPTGRPAGHRMAPRAAELIAQRVPFVQATVVRAETPTSARPGDDAIVLGDGTIEGFVGGQCAQESVRTAALAALADGEPVLLRVLPDGRESFPERPGAQLAVNPCLSGGALEIFLEPQLPQPLVEIVGDTPIARAVESVAHVLGFAVGRGMPARPPGDAVAVIVMTHGTDEPESIRAALDAGIGHIGLVASHKRGAAVLSAMELTEPERARVQTPAGIAIGARTAEEIALSIMAAVVKAVRVDGVTAPAGRAAQPEQAIDPVCGMTVVITGSTPAVSIDGVDYWFCGPGCRDRFAAQAGEHAGGRA